MKFQMVKKKKKDKIFKLMILMEFCKALLASQGGVCVSDAASPGGLCLERYVIFPIYRTLSFRCL